ncbi:MAG: histone deacetylase family protein [Halobacteriaceae archaeon]
MRFGFSDTCLEHDPGPRHPESPDRLRAIRRKLAKAHGVTYVDANGATEEDVYATHDPDYLDEIQQFVANGGGNWDPDTVATERTWVAARTSAGLAAWAADEALDGQDGRATPFSLGRPPGHHATYDDAMGFCFLNNAAVATEHVLRDRADRVAIFDWDVHHGNGTQDIFYDRGDVLYCSIHEEGLYPGTGDTDETGEGEGAGTTLNVPLPPGAGDDEYRFVVESLIGPAIVEFDPDLLLVSAGFDAHRHDPISRMHVTTDGYGLLADRVRDVAADADAALGFVLEGGYSLDTLSESVHMVHEVFDGLRPHVDPDDPAADVVDLVADIRERRQGVGSK